MTCIICQQTNISNIIQDYCICFNCFHISNSHTENDTEQKQHTNQQIYNGIFLQYLFKELEDLIKSKHKISVVSVGGFDTYLLDLIKSRFGKNVTTTSISEKFNASYFSNHKSYKLSLNMYVNINNYDTFDFVILNDILDYTFNPINILKKCKMICNNDGTIYSMNLHASILLSLDYMNMKQNTINIWSTHSVKMLCQYSDMLVSDVFKVPNMNNRIYKITHCKSSNNELTNPIIEDLYDEICQGFYSIAFYHSLKQFWSMYIEMCNVILAKYTNHNYKIIGVNPNVYNLLTISTYINEDFINENLETFYKDEKIVFVILNYLLYDKLVKCLKSRNHLIFDLHNLIIV